MWSIRHLACRHRRLSRCHKNSECVDVSEIKPESYGGLFALPAVWPGRNLLSGQNSIAGNCLIAARQHRCSSLR
jgi:hypothetical protein